MMKLYKKKSVVVILALILLNCSSLSVSAQGGTFYMIGNNSATQNVSAFIQSQLSESVQNFKKKSMELTPNRTFNTKQFLLEDGSYQAEIYNSDIHYKDEQGNYQEIEARFVDEVEVSDLKATYSGNFARKYKSKSKEHSKGIKKEVSNYVAAQVPFNLEIHKKIAEGYSIEKDGNEIHIIPLNVHKNSTAKLDKETGGKLTFSNAWKNTDLELVVMPMGIKENIIIKSSDSPKQFTFEIKKKITNIENVGNLSFLPLWLIDKNGTYRDVNAKERTEGSKTYMDLEWDAKGLVYPITIDPSIVAGRQSAVVVNSGGGIITPYDLQIGGTQGPYEVPKNSHLSTTQSYVLYSLPQLPSEAIIKSATLSLYYIRYMNSGSGYNPSPTFDFYPYYVDNDITGSLFEWKDKPPYYSSISGQLVHLNLLSPANTLYESNITALVNTAYSKQKNKLTVAMVSSVHNLNQSDVRVFLGNGYMTSRTSKITINYVLKNTFFYDINGRLEYIFFSDGRKLKYKYDYNGNLLNNVFE